ncbi:DUF6082 family protein [Streptomyces sp. NPDC012751]|uniref:DUF6082 family protein n=1 Tax=Streptomyces sp. NPDC012751 TaxID=3364846 RepID=UPI0036C0D857
MKASTAVLVVAAVGAIGIYQRARHGKQALTLQAAALHQALCRDAAASPALYADQEQGDNPEVTKESRMAHANAWVSLLSARFRAGLLDQPALRRQALALMRLDSVRDYWTEHGGHREDDANDFVDETFNEVMEGAYLVRIHRDSAPRTSALVGSE